jgi:predicted O-methyltransferase YrrM
MKAIRACVDLVLAVLLVPAGYLFRLVRARSLYRLPRTRAVLMHIGVFPIIDHYYEPLFNSARLLEPLDTDRDLPGLTLNEHDQVLFLSKLNYSAELTALDLHQNPKYDLQNPNFGPTDAQFLYQFLRETKPATIIEIGGGYSSKMIEFAIAKNGPTHHMCIEPYEMPWLDEMGVEVIRKRVEECPMNLFEKLKSGDFLFIDSSHVIRPQGDVLHEYFRILPRLASGVNVHVHDIFTPRDYPKAWLADRVRLWNEQYLLEMLLHSERYQILAALNFLKNHRSEMLRAICPYPDSVNEPGSLYFKVR